MSIFIEICRTQKPNIIYSVALILKPKLNIFLSLPFMHVLYLRLRVWYHCKWQKKYQYHLILIYLSFILCQKFINVIFFCCVTRQNGNAFISLCDECNNSGFSQMNWAWAFRVFFCQNIKSKTTSRIKK